ncbi:uncharacterized protein BT62DRAFT_935603 [Guyanagaster necrorhizus]|uniref:Protein YOP1 n=1 Tax=Guyanagaster necrorhizus TaxID=856835 RepID=A0A9P7VM57_9AGAR|nr:uncharacterized protein BT62DRAFT_935603 [Guyanagaster necrorhizus MCA 3950]KAG7442875.1 hypothetical protein BT62DRAFT_935603 [Guyanagaster necrorhizus MCA 3950]
MLFYLTSRIICSVSAFLYPGYASYKTLSQRPASEEELERWLMYWSVLGCIVAVEYIAEWLISWIPFYYLTKTLFLLYLSLPQTQGSTYLYINHLEPFFSTHEAQIDATTASLKAKLYAFIQSRARALWDQVSASVGQQSSSDSVAGGGPEAPPPSLNNPVSGPAQLVTSFWKSYGPSIVASGAALLKQAAPAPTPTSSRIGPSSSGSTTRSILERRRQLEAELAALPRVGEPMPSGSPLLSPSRVSSDQDMYLREHSTSVSGRYEEIEVPGDVEGYDVGTDSVGHSYDSRPAAQKRGSSWFSWGGGSSTSDYERVKNE